MGKRDWEKDRRNHLPKEIPTDSINDQPQIDREPPQGRESIQHNKEIAKLTRRLSKSWESMNLEELQKTAADLNSQINKFSIKNQGWSVEIQNARTVLDRVAGRISTLRAEIPKLYRIVRFHKGKIVPRRKRK